MMGADPHCNDCGTHDVGYWDPRGDRGEVLCARCYAARVAEEFLIAPTPRWQAWLQSGGLPEEYTREQ